MRIPPVGTLHEYHPELAKMVGKTSWLPNPDTVALVGGAVFPTSRHKRQHPRFSHIEENGIAIGMYDDNVTPKWAMVWAHGLTGTHTKGWTIAHVWPTSDDATAYTHLANLVMVPEAFASLTDKNGPLTGFLRWHAWNTYAWKPERQAEPPRPEGYDAIEWRYLDFGGDPKALIQKRLEELKNQRTMILRPIMKGGLRAR